MQCILLHHYPPLHEQPIDLFQPEHFAKCIDMNHWECISLRNRSMLSWDMAKRTEVSLCPAQVQTVVLSKPSLYIISEIDLFTDSQN